MSEKIRKRIGNVQGPPGATFTPDVSATLDLSWTNDGGLTNPPTVNLKDAIPAATTSEAGLMSANDKATLEQAVTDIAGKLDASRVGVSGGVAELDENGKVPSAQLPSFVDDVLERASLSAFPSPGESGKIYVAVDTNLSYRWSGSGYVEISPSLALGETPSTAHRGDHGKAAYEHSQTTGNAHNMTKADIGLGNVPNVATNDQTPTYTAASALAALTSGEKLSAAFGKLARGVSDLIAHIADNVKHITAAERAAWNNKVDAAPGMGLSANSYTTAEKLKLEGIEPEAEVNEVSAEQYASALGAIFFLNRENKQLRTTLNNLIAGLSVPLTMTMSGTKGYLFIKDAAAGTVSSLTVDSSLSGTTLYIQIRNVSANTFQSVTATVDANGNVPVSGLTVTYGNNEVYVAKTAYVWKDNMSTTIGTDHKPTNGVDFTITYPRDKDLGIEVDKGCYGWDDLLKFCGYKATRTAYASTADAIAGFNNGEIVVVKVDSDFNEYSKACQVPLKGFAGTYYRETYSLIS